MTSEDLRDAIQACWLACEFERAIEFANGARCIRCGEFPRGLRDHNSWVFELAARTVSIHYDIDLRSAAKITRNLCAACCDELPNDVAW